MTFLRVQTVISGSTGAPWLNTLCFEADILDDGQDAADAVAAFWGSVDALMDSTTSWVVQPTVVEINEATGNPVAFHTVSGGTGTGAVADISLPYATQGLIRLFTGSVVNHHQVRGRIYVPGLTRNNLAEGTLNSTGISALDAAAEALIADADSSLVVWARPVDAEHATEHSPERVGTIHPVVAAQVWDQFAVLTSRRD